MIESILLTIINIIDCSYFLFIFYEQKKTEREKEAEEALYVNWMREYRQHTHIHKNTIIIIIIRTGLFWRIQAFSYKVKKKSLNRIHKYRHHRHTYNKTWNMTFIDSISFSFVWWWWWCQCSLAILLPRRKNWSYLPI